MGVSAHISFDQWPKQGTFLNLRAEVCFRYDTERVVMGTIVRNDSEGDGITIIKLDDGRFVLGTECQYRPIYGSAHEPSAGVKCTHCNGKGYNEPIYDEQDGWIDETPCETCNGSGRITTVEQYLKTLPANWHEDSSHDTWFPITAEELKRLKDERASQPPSASDEFPADCDVIDITCDEDDERVIEFVFVRDDICVKGQSVTKDAGECGACDKPGEHCANVHGICSRHGGRPHETSAVHKAHDPTCGVFAGMACDCGWLDEHR